MGHQMFAKYFKNFTRNSKYIFSRELQQWKLAKHFKNITMIILINGKMGKKEMTF